jgi:hypothetical protein
MKWKTYLAHCRIQDILLCPRHAMAQTVSGRTLIAQAQVQSQASQCGIRSQQNGTDSGVSLRVIVLFPSAWFHQCSTLNFYSSAIVVK